MQVDTFIIQGTRKPFDEDVIEDRPLPSIEMRMFEHRSRSVQANDVSWLPWSVFMIYGGPNLCIASFSASNATFDLNSGLCCFHFDISGVLRVEDQQTTNCSLRQCPNFGGVAHFLNFA